MNESAAVSCLVFQTSVRIAHAVDHPMTKSSETSLLTHFDADGKAHMVDVGAKPPTHRIATASGRIEMKPETLLAIQSGTAIKGDVIGVARLAGIMAAKKTSDLIPLCHQVPLSRVAIKFEASDILYPGTTGLFCSATVESVWSTGVEIEALTAVQIALLTVFDMCKAIDRGMSIQDVLVDEKHGGRSGSWLNGHPAGHTYTNS